MPSLLITTRGERETLGLPSAYGVGTDQQEGNGRGLQASAPVHY